MKRTVFDGRDNMKKLGVSSLCIAMILLGIFGPLSGAGVDSRDYSRLENGEVTPENGWTDTNFTFKVAYLNPENVALAENYPKLLIDGVEISMKEANTSDNNLVDGKVYVKTWLPGPENLGTHTFSFQARDVRGEKIDYPENETFKGPTVKAKTEIELSLEREDEKLVFSGRLKLMGENVVLEGENITIYRIFSGENRRVGSVLTTENGSFSLEIEVPEGNGMSRYRAMFSDGEIFGEAGSASVYFNSFDFVSTFLIPLFVVLAMLLLTGYLLNRSLDLRSHLTLILIGSFVSWILFQFFGFGLGVLIGGGVIGYFLSRETDEWTDWLMVGFFAGVIASSLSIFSILSTFVALPEIAGAESGFLFFYSFTQGEFLYSLLYASVWIFALFVSLIALGTLMGGFLRKFF